MKEEHNMDCDGLCYECEAFSWCELSPCVKESIELDILELETNNIINNQI